MESVPGVRSAEVNLDKKRAVVEVDEAAAQESDLAQAVERAGYHVGDGPGAPRQLVSLELQRPGEPEASASVSSSGAAAPSGVVAQTQPEADASGSPSSAAPPPAPERLLLDIEGMHCASCVSRVAGALESVPGVSAAHVNLAMEQASVEFDPKRTEARRLARGRQGQRLRGQPSQRPDERRRSARKDRREVTSWGRRVGIGLGLLIALAIAMYGSVGSTALRGWLQLLLASVLQVYLGWPYFAGAIERLRHGSTNMDTLIALGTGAAYCAGAFHWAFPEPHGHGMYFLDAAMILVFITCGKLLEALAKGRASAAIRRLLDLSPAEANLLVGGQPRRVPVETVSVGETILVRPGERILAGRQDRFRRQRPSINRG